jgi:hypothetical protein
MRRISIKSGGVTLEAELHDTPTADAIWAALPITSSAQTWGDEIYFSTGLSLDREGDARRVVSVGELAFWIDGSAIAVCFGPTPVSTADEIRLISDANIWGQLLGDARALAAIRDGDAISVERAT